MEGGEAPAALIGQFKNSRFLHQPIMSEHPKLNGLVTKTAIFPNCLLFVFSKNNDDSEDLLLPGEPPLGLWLVMHTFLSKIPEITQNSSKKLLFSTKVWAKSKTRFAEKKSQSTPPLFGPIKHSSLAKRFYK